MHLKIYVVFAQATFVNNHDRINAGGRQFCAALLKQAAYFDQQNE
jgi:hypothetical protein